MIKEDKSIELMYVVCLEAEAYGPDPGGNSWPATWNFNQEAEDEANEETEEEPSEEEE